MKKKHCIYGIITLMILILTSCASQFTLVAHQTCAEATALKNICTSLQNDTRERMVTDSLYNQGAALIRTGDNEKAHVQLGRVIIRYRLILERQAIAGKEREIELQKRGLAQDLHELATCQRKIDELTATVKP